uniref:Uncharacterized protein n=1 Tax=Ignisphaera aggregans TaxID=334771 RepID=A0A7J2U5K1_9CREN
MSFVSRKKKESIDWSMPKHLTEIWVKQKEKPTIEDTIIVKNALSIVDHVLKSSGVKKYKIVYFVDWSNTVPLDIDEVSDDMEKYGCLGIGGFDEELECLEEKTGKKYVLLYIENVPATVAAEVLE